MAINNLLKDGNKKNLLYLMLFSRTFCVLALRIASSGYQTLSPSSKTRADLTKNKKNVNTSKLLCRAWNELLSVSVQTNCRLQAGRRHLQLTSSWPRISKLRNNARLSWRMCFVRIHTQDSSKSEIVLVVKSWIR